MINLQKISRCLISVSEKEGVVELAKYLASKGVEIISTGGTKKILSENKIPVKDISDFTNFPEIFDGRVKTLHHKVHGALLAVMDNASHKNEAKENEISSIDLLIVNFYPFEKTVESTNNEEHIIENIDIGGPAMTRSAAKNFLYKTVITSIDQYKNLTEEMEKNSGATSFEFRKEAASSAFANIAKYDIAIANWFNKSDFSLYGKLKQTLRYGENAHQKASVYSTNNSGIVNAIQIQGKELSYNNLNDCDAAYNLVLEFSSSACAIIKHANPCGAAISDNLDDAYKKALACDTKSAFGGIVALNGKIDEALARAISEVFYEVIIAKEIDEKAKEIFSAKKNLRVILADFKKEKSPQIKTISGGFLMQESDSKSFDISDLKCVSKASVKNEELAQLVFAMSVCKHVKSNAIVVAKDFQTIGVGIGQTNRVDSCEIACKKSGEEAAGAYLASDAFFPFADNIEIAAKYKIRAIVAPSGSIRDAEVIAKADECGIALYFIDTRHFKH